MQVVEQKKTVVRKSHLFVAGIQVEMNNKCSSNGETRLFFPFLFIKIKLKMHFCEFIEPRIFPNNKNQQ